MTKIPSVEKEILKWMNAYIPEGKTVPVFEDMLEQYATTQRTALLTELRDCGLLEEKPELPAERNWKRAEEIHRLEAHNTLARAIKAHLDELINSTSL